ncbi:DUF397 domain-containing protein [Streptomyces sp. NPDC002845]
MSIAPHEKADLYSIDLSGATWYKSPFSAGENDCVEITDLPGGAVAVRDSKNPDKGALRFTASEWDALRQGFRAGLL